MVLVLVERKKNKSWTGWFINAYCPWWIKELLMGSSEKLKCHCFKKISPLCVHTAKYDLNICYTASFDVHEGTHSELVSQSVSQSPSKRK